MIPLVFAMLLFLAAIALFASYTMFGGLLQVLLVIALMGLGIHRIRRVRIDY